MKYIWIFFALFVVLTMAVTPLSADSNSVKTKAGDQLFVKPDMDNIRTGTVEGFTMDRVFIDDVGYVLSGNIEFYASLGDPAPVNKFKRGCRVKYVLNDHDEVEILQLVMALEEEP